MKPGQFGSIGASSFAEIGATGSLLSSTGACAAATGASVAATGASAAATGASVAGYSDLDSSFLAEVRDLSSLLL